MTMDQAPIPFLDAFLPPLARKPLLPLAPEVILLGSLTSTFLTFSHERSSLQHLQSTIVLSLESVGSYLTIIHSPLAFCPPEQRSVRSPPHHWVHS